MSADTFTIPDEVAQRTARLINEAENMREQAADDLKTIYGDLREELKALGWAGQNVSKEVAALKGAIAEIRLDEQKRAKREEKGDRVDDYVSILSKGRARAPARTRENIEQFNPLTGEFIDDAPVTIIDQTDADGHHVKVTVDPEIAAILARSEAPRSDGGLDIVTKHTEIATNEGGANQDSVDMAQGSVPGLEPSGPEAERATQFTAKLPSPLRPHCQRPENCGGYGRTHCGTCLRAKEREMA